MNLFGVQSASDDAEREIPKENIRFMIPDITVYTFDNDATDDFWWKQAHMKWKINNYSHLGHDVGQKQFLCSFRGRKEMNFSRWAP